MPSFAQNGIKYYTPHKDFVDLLRRELRRRKEIEAGLEMSEAGESKRRNKEIDRLKVYYLDKHIFPAMANLIFLFEAVALHPELEKLYENEIKDLLGLRHDKSQQYGFTFRKMLHSILLIGNEESRTKQHNKRGDFRLSLNYILQGIVLDKVRMHLPDIFKPKEAQIAVKDDLHRAWGWTRMLAPNIDDEEELPHRSFDFETKKLLKLLK
jgi:hypothetical protein